MLCTYVTYVHHFYIVCWLIYFSGSIATIDYLLHICQRIWTPCRSFEHRVCDLDLKLIGIYLSFINFFRSVLFFQVNCSTHFCLLMACRVIFGMMVSLPVLIAYFAVLEFVHWSPSYQLAWLFQSMDRQRKEIAGPRSLVFPFFVCFYFGMKLLVGLI